MSRFCRPLRSLSFCLPVPEYSEDMEAYSSGRDIKCLLYGFCRSIQALCCAAYEGAHGNLHGCEHDISRRGMALWWLVWSFYPATLQADERFKVYLRADFCERLDALYQNEVDLATWNAVYNGMFQADFNDALRDSVCTHVESNTERLKANRAAEKQLIMHLTRSD